MEKASKSCIHTCMYEKCKVDACLLEVNINNGNEKKNDMCRQQHVCKGDCRVGLSWILAGGPKLIYYAK